MGTDRGADEAAITPAARRSTESAEPVSSCRGIDSRTMRARAWSVIFPLCLIVVTASCGDRLVQTISAATDVPFFAYASFRETLYGPPLR